MNPAPERRSLQAYLLGTLPAAEAEALESRYFEEGPLFDELLLAEEDLIDAYVAGRLAPAEALAFESAFLASPPRRERVEFARALQRAAAAARPPSQRWTGVLLAAAAAVACLALAAWVSLRLGGAEAELEASRGRLSALQSEVEDLRGNVTRLSQDLAATARPVGGVVSWVLGSRLNRGTPAPPPLVLPPGIDWVRLRLPVEGADARSVEVQTPEGRMVWSQAALGKGSSPAGSTLDVMVPARALAPGTYVVLAKREDGREAASFALRVSPNP